LFAASRLESYSKNKTVRNFVEFMDWINGLTTYSAANRMTATDKGAAERLLDELSRFIKKGVR
jgi:hypothetical protein